MTRKPSRALCALAVAVLLAACAAPTKAELAPTTSAASPLSETSTTTAPPVTVTVTHVPSPTKTLTFTDVRERAAPSVVRLEQRNCGSGSGVGSGFFIDPSHVVTAAHVVEGAARLASTSLPAGTSVQVVGIDTAHDIALLRVAPAVATAGLSLADPARAGDHVLILGYPLGVTELRSSEGTVNGVEGTISEMQGRSQMDHLVVIDNAVAPGNSGGPVLNQGGNVAAMVIAKMTRDSLGSDPREGFAVSVDRITADVRAWHDDATLPTVDCNDPALNEEGLTVPHVITPTDSYARSAALTVLRHGQFLTDGQYRQAWDFFTADEQNHVGGFTQWSSDVGSSRWEYLNVPYVDVTGSHADVSAVLMTTQPRSRGYQGQTCSVFQLKYELVRSGSSWLINRARYLDGFDAPSPCPT